jgi:hypothetical protein
VPVVGIDKAEVPQLRALVRVRHAGRSELDEQLGERVDGSERRDAAREGLELREERRDRLLGEECVGELP